MESTPTRGKLPAEPYKVTPYDEDCESVSKHSDNSVSDPPILSNAHTSQSPLVEKQRYFQPAPLDKEHRRRRSLTSDALDEMTVNRNVILPLDQLLRFIETNFLCRRCNRKLTKSEDIRDVPILGLEVFGLAIG